MGIQILDIVPVAFIELNRMSGMGTDRGEVVIKHHAMKMYGGVKVE
jgi:hypothetical protein